MSMKEQGITIKRSRVEDEEKMDNYHKDVEEISLCM
jgi:hypothetical protein